MAKPLRVLYVTSTLRRCGPVTVLYNIVKYLDRNEIEPVVLTLSPEPADSMLLAFRELGVTVDSLSLSRVSGFSKGPEMLRLYAKQGVPDIIQSHGIRGDVLSATSLSGFARIALLHSNVDADYCMTYGTIKGKLMAFSHLQALRRINQVVSCSKNLARTLATSGIEHVRVIPNGVDEAKFYPCTEAYKETLREKLGIPVDRRVAVFVGHLTVLKDPETLIRGFLGCEFSSQMLLYLLGDGPLEGRCLDLTQDKSNVRLVGRVSNVIDFLHASDFFASASRTEGLPNAVLEALACGLPICLSDIPGHREFLESESSIGTMFNTGNTTSLSESLSAMYKMDLRSVRTAILGLVHHELSAAQMARRYATLYQSLC